MPTTWTATLWYDDLEPVDHSALGLARLIWQYRGDQPRVQSWLEAFLDQVDSVEDMAYDVYTGLWPLTAVGMQLTTLGKIVGQPRAELVDDEYRLFILGRIFVNKGDGQLPQFYELLDIIGYLDDAAAYDLIPAALWVEVYDATYSWTIFDLVDDLHAGGVLLTFVYSTVGKDETFRASSSYGGDDTTAANGAGSVYDATVGGQSAGCYR